MGLFPYNINMNNKAVKIYFKKGTTLQVLFSDGITKQYDVLLFANKYPQLNKLNNRKLFIKGKLFGTSAIVWNDELDIDVDVIYEDGNIVENADDACEVLLGYQIKQARLKKQLTQFELSNKIDIDQADLSKIENGKLCPSLSTIKRIAKGLNTKITINVQ